MGLFKDRYGYLRLWVYIAVIVGLCTGIPLVWAGAANAAWFEGVETVTTGTVVLHQLRYDKFWNMKYTDLEIRTYSGDTHHVRFLGHTDLEHETAYRITTRSVNYWGHLYIVQEIVKIEEYGESTE